MCWIMDCPKHWLETSKLPPVLVWVMGYIANMILYPQMFRFPDTRHVQGHYCSFGSRLNAILKCLGCQSLGMFKGTIEALVPVSIPSSNVQAKGTNNDPLNITQKTDNTMVKGANNDPLNITQKTDNTMAKGTNNDPLNNDKFSIKAYEKYID